MIGYPLDSHVEFDKNNVPVYDRAVSSAPLRKLIKKLFSDGVMPNPSTNLQVSAGNGLEVTVQPGFAICNGCLKLEEEQISIALQAADTSYGRIDTVVIRLDDNDSVRSCELAVLTGTPASSPVRPSLTRNGSVWEIGLADIKISVNSKAVSNANITDTRYETARCGVISSISEFDTTALYQQVLGDLEDFKTEEQAEFLVWFGEMKNQLSADAAGNLQLQIEVERNRINALTKMEEGSTTGDAELQDIRVGADGVTYDSAGEAVRTQFTNALGSLRYTLPVKLSETTKDKGMLLGNAWVGSDVSTIMPGSSIGEFACIQKVKKGDIITISSNVDLNWRTGNNDRVLITDNDHIVQEIIYYTTLANDHKIKVEEDGYFYISSTYNDENIAELFTILRLRVLSPLVLSVENAEEYITDSLAGDEVLNAILSGRQILVRVPNADSGSFTAIYSPIYMYQLPNQDNNYLYLFYLRDEKQDLDLSALGMGTVQMPIYGELKLLLSQTYNTTPLV